MTLPIMMDGGASPTLNLNFAGTGVADPRLTVTRSGTAATYFNAAGVLTVAGANTARIDYDPATLACKGLLIEEARTNIAKQSGTFTTTWAPNGATVAGAGISVPDGTTGGYKFTESAGGSVHELFQTFTNVSGTTYTHSVVMKAGTRTWATVAFYDGVSAIGAYFDLINGVVGSSTTGFSGAPTRTKIQPFGNGWYRCSVTWTVGATGGNVFFGLATGDGVKSYSGDGSSYIYVWHSQQEAGGFPTTPIYTTTAAVTRAADGASILTSAFGFSISGATFVMELQRIASVPGILGSTPVLAVTDGGAANIVNFVNLNSAGALESTPYVAGSVSAAMPAITSTGTIKIGLGVASAGNSMLCVNGGSVTQATAGAWLPPATTKINIGAERLGDVSCLWFRQLRVFSGCLSGTILKGLTR